MIIDNYESLEFGLAVCNQCNIENSWNEQIKQLLLEEFTEEAYNDFFNGKGLPNDSSFIKKFYELIEHYKVKCLIINNNEAICPFHFLGLQKEFYDYQR